MLLDRLQRPARGVRIVRRNDDDNPPFRVQLVPLRPIEIDEVAALQEDLADDPGPIVTAALSPREQQPFLAAGFTMREELHLLRHFLDHKAGDSHSPAVIRGARRSDQRVVLDIDRQSFDDFWAMDRHGLQAARRATPVHRYVVATMSRNVVGYMIAGRAGSTAFLQRLGVAPEWRGHGIGGQLIRDALDWARQSAASSMLVNTQVVNERAKAIYESMGFELDDERLAVLEWVR